MRVGRHVGHNLYDDENNCIGHMHTDEAAKDIVNKEIARQRVIDTCQKVRDVQGPSGMINASQIIGLLSLTWPDGNYSSGG